MMTSSKIKMEEREGEWHWQVSVGTFFGLGGETGRGRSNDYCAAYQQAFNFILKVEDEGYFKYSPYKVISSALSVLSGVTYLGVA